MKSIAFAIIIAAYVVGIPGLRGIENGWIHALILLCALAGFIYSIIMGV